MAFVRACALPSFVRRVRACVPMSRLRPVRQRNPKYRRERAHTQMLTQHTHTRMQTVGKNIHTYVRVCCGIFSPQIRVAAHLCANLCGRRTCTYRNAHTKTGYLVIKYTFSACVRVVRGSVHVCACKLQWNLYMSVCVCIRCTVLLSAVRVWGWTRTTTSCYPFGSNPVQKWWWRWRRLHVPCLLGVSFSLYLYMPVACCVSITQYTTGPVAAAAVFSPVRISHLMTHWPGVCAPKSCVCIPYTIFGDCRCGDVTAYALCRHLETFRDIWHRVYMESAKQRRTSSWEAHTA